MTLYLWIISQDKNDGYDTYDSAVVCAENDVAAKSIHPNGYKWDGDEWIGTNSRGECWRVHDGTWTHPGNVSAERIGVADAGVTAGSVLCSSFNAG